MVNQRQPKAKKPLTRSRVRNHIVSIVVLAVFCVVVVLPKGVNIGINWINEATNIGIPTIPTTEFSLGLDLQGGAHLVYQADVSKVPEVDRASSVEGVRDVIERRVRGGLGVAEPLVQTTRVSGDYRVIIELPGIKDVNQAINLIGETPTLEFKEANDAPARDLTAEETKQLEEFNTKANTKIREALVEATKPGADFAAVVKKYSEDVDDIKDKDGDIGFVSASQLPALHQWAASHKDGDISTEVIEDIGGLNVVKRLAARQGEEEILASHLLLCYQGVQGCHSNLSKDDAKKKAEELKKQTTPENFADLVKDNTTEPGGASRFGDLGWFGRGRMVVDFENAVFDQDTGTISDPVETQFGYHLIHKREQRQAQEYQLARVFVQTQTAADIVPPTDAWDNTELSGKQLKRAEVIQDPQTSEIQVSLQFDSEGTRLFAEITQNNIGRQVAIFLDGQPISVPTVHEAITTGNAVISGGFTLEDARLLAQRLNSGALPVPVELISQQTVDATLGAESLEKSVGAAIYGLIAVLIFMILYYRLPGLLAAISLTIYAILALAIFKLIGVTLTLAGIAGFILSLGMAVDANVLIFERLKEELRQGSGLKSGVEDAFHRAWPSIRDGNITTLISCVVLIMFVSGFVQGFAVTLAIGVVSSMFTAVVVTKAMLRLVAGWVKAGANRAFLGYTKFQQNDE